jgi:two-component system, chemotaxis family, chemotaxis protein CheY
MTPTTILLCDDALFMRTMLRGIVTAGGCEVVGEAENGLAAVEMYIRLRPDVVLMDMVMPLMGGVEALREIRKFDPNAHVLMCSAMGQRQLVDESLEAGARGFISKPFTAAHVMETLAELGVVTP